MLTATWIAYVCALCLLGVYGAHRLYLTLYARRAGGASASASSGNRASASSGRGASASVGDPATDPLPVVTVQLPLFNELFVAARVVDAAAALDWPADKLEIQILDDSTDETTALCQDKVHALRRRGVDVLLLHRRDRVGYKAGALAAGLARARGDIIFVFDADFVPPPTLLREVIPRFADPAVGMVQVRWEHLNRDHSALTRVQSLLLDGHFAIEQRARAAAGRYFNFNGTAGAWRRIAIHDAGGWQHDTLTEDLDLSYRALLAGWKFDYLNDRVAPAELPADMNGFKAQQYRWAKGSAQVARKLLPRVLAAPIPRAVKLEAFFHLTQNVPYLITLALVLLTVPALVLRPGSAAEVWWLHAPMMLVTTATLGAYCVCSQRLLGRGGVVATLATLARLPALIAITAGISVSQSRAVLEGAVGHSSPFVRTPKRGDSAAQRRPWSWPWRRWRYASARGLTPLAELALAVHFAAALAGCAAAGRYSLIPILAVFASGFSYVGLRSLLGR